MMLGSSPAISAKKEIIMHNTRIVQIENDESFIELLHAVDPAKQTIVKFGAIWCSPCTTMKRSFFQASESKLDIDFFETDIDECPASAAFWKIQSLPTTVLYVGSEEVSRKEGLLSSTQILEWIDKSKK